MPELNGEHESQVRAGLLQVLRDQREPDYREATLIALLLTVRKLATLFPAEDSAAIYTRAEEIAKDHWIQKAPKTRGVLDSAGAQIVEGVGDILSAWP
ncbi:GPP34 family phosphoprotein [Ornithinimicrobium sp. INDO-MA30-4]|uniref:GPP34 family phosphoprotein n=1 Tax=Ornithinimicrobium sp. INDO-MA30-4 TaxID=2908651 RepID=UPI001F171996|nr:GPP34 family phosphoprotein [Ornithinimicrobium sp. INDO-MA30-4]UJH69522.1 GPP34 family phosphoprotein [Ornithinimicrobium sp. INDO-MA30-4]